MSRSESQSSESSGGRQRQSGKRLLRYARRGRADKLRRLLRRHRVGIDTGGRDGRTALHWAAAGGHDEAVELLLRRGADATSLDSAGDTAAHLAARWVTHKPAVLLAFGATGALGVRDGAGATARDVAARLLAQHSAAEDEARRWQSDARQASAARRTPFVDSAWAEEEGADDAYYAQWEAASADMYESREAEAGVTEGGCDEAAHAARWRRSARAEAEAASARPAQGGNSTPEAGGNKFEDWKRAEAAKRGEEAARVLHEERAKDAAWRAAVAAGGSLQQRRAAYVAAWAALDAAPEDQPMRSSDLPWPSAAGAEAADVAQLLLAGVPPEAHKAALRAEMRRWHPDKLGARFGGRLPEAVRAAVWPRVNAVCQAITDAYQRL